MDLDFEVLESDNEIWDSIQALFLANPWFSLSLPSAELIDYLFPWILSGMLMREECPSTIFDILNSFHTLRFFQSFNYFFSHNENVHLLPLLRRRVESISCTETAINVMLIFFFYRSSALKKNNSLKGFIFHYAEAVAIKETFNACRSPIISLAALEVLWKSPFVVAHLMKMIVCHLPLGANAYAERLLDHFPTSLFDCEDYTMNVISHLTFFTYENASNFFKLPQKVIEPLIKFAKRKMEAQRLEISSMPFTPNEVHFQPFIRHLFCEYARRNANNFNFSKDLLIFGSMHCFKIMDTEELVDLLIRKWKLRGIDFFRDASPYFGHPFLSLIADEKLAELIPSDTFGDAVYDFMMKVTATPNDRSRLSSEYLISTSKAMDCLGRILSTRGERSDLHVPHSLLVSRDEARRKCALSYLYNFFLRHHIDENFKTTSSFIQLVQEEKLDDAHLFRQCLQCWAKGSFEEFNFVSTVPLQCPLSWTFHELTIALKHENNLRLLHEDCGKAPSVSECRRIMEDLKVLDHICDVHVLLLYFPHLEALLLSYLHIDKAWLYDLGKEKWSNQSLHDLTRCARCFRDLLSALPDAFNKLIRQHSPTPVSILFQHCARIACNGKKEIRDSVICHVASLVKETEDCLNSIIETVQAKSMRVNDAEKMLLLLQKSGRTFEEETCMLNHCGICCFLSNDMQRSEINNTFLKAADFFSLFHQIYQLLCPREKKNIFQQFAFGCYTDDICKDAELKYILLALEKAAPMVEEMTLKEHESLMESQLRSLTTLPIGGLATRRLFNLLENVVHMEHIWAFFNEHPLLLDESNEYTAQFEDEIDGRLEKAGEQVVEVLGNLKVVAPVVATLRKESRRESFLSCLEAIFSRPLIFKQLVGSEENWISFVEKLQQVNNNMKIVKYFFDNTDNPIDAVIRTYEEVQKGYTFVFRIHTSEVFMSFYQDDVVRNLEQNDVNEFVMHLRFAARERVHRFPPENGTADDTIESFLSEMDLLSQLFPIIRELYATGYPKIFNTNVLVKRMKSPPLNRDISKEGFTELEWKDLTSLHMHLNDWCKQLQKCLSENPWLVLLSIPVARELSQLLQKSEEYCDKIVFYALSSFLLIPESSFSDFKKSIKQAVENQGNPGGNWLSFFISCVSGIVHPKEYNTGIQRTIGRTSQRLCKLYHCKSDSDGFALLSAIYRNKEKGTRLWPFQVFYCDSFTTSTYLKDAFRAIEHRPELVYTFLRADLLPFAQQGELQQFINAGTYYSEIHCIECSESVLRMCEGVQEVDQSEITLSSKRKLCSAFQPKDVHLTCFYGGSGCGKTYQLRKTLKEYQKKSSCLLFFIVVREDFHLSEAIEVLKKAVVECEKNKATNCLALAIHFSLGFYSSKQRLELDSLFRLANRMLFSLIEMRCLEDRSESGSVVALPSSLSLNLFIELPSSDIFIADPTDEKGSNFPFSAFPILDAYNIDKKNCEHAPFDLENEATSIAKYLKAYEDGTIDTQSTKKRRTNLAVLFLLDASGSMNHNSRRDHCNKSIIQTCQKMHPDDYAGLITFSEKIRVVWKLNPCTPSNIRTLKDRLDCEQLREGSRIYSGFLKCLEVFQQSSLEFNKKFIIALSDGGVEANDYMQCMKKFAENKIPISVVFIAIDVKKTYETQLKIAFSNKVESFTWITAKDNEEEISCAFGDAANHLSVNEQIEKNAENITKEEVNTLIEKHMRSKDGRMWSRVQQALWIRYMYRRCSILASSKKFDKNTTLEHYGSLTMKMMLMEAQHAVDKNHVSWEDSHHEHMVYREAVVEKKGSQERNEVDYQWSIIAIHQEKDPQWAEKEEVFKNLGMHVPRAEDLIEPAVLESYLAYAIGATLVGVGDCKIQKDDKEKVFDFPLGRLPGINEEGFILTVDFLMKMLLINERVNCRALCIIMGETGISKTKVTKTLFALKNHCHAVSLQQKRLSEILEWTAKGTKDSYSALSYFCSWLRIPFYPLRANFGEDSIFSLCSSHSSFRRKVGAALLKVFEQDPSLDPLQEFPITYLTNLTGIEDNSETICVLIEWLLAKNATERKYDENNWMFIPFDIHAGVTAPEIKSVVTKAAERVTRIHQLGKALPTFFLHQRAQICIFFDEFNTTSCMGLLKEILLDRSLDGYDLPSELISIAACNPYREKRKSILSSNRGEEPGIEWVSGHYHVERIPKPLEDMTWNYGSLQPFQEQEFICKAVSLRMGNFDKELRARIAEVLYTAHTTTKYLAKEHLQHCADEKKLMYSVTELEERAASSVSLRDILRFFRLFQFFLFEIDAYVQRTLFPAFERMDSNEAAKEVLTLSVAFVYYFRFPSYPNEAINFRKRFSQCMKKLDVDIEGIVSRCIESVMKHTKVDPWIYKTKSLSENIFVILFCIASKTPIIVKGPPGTSKTMAVKILCSNAMCAFSHNQFYRSLPALCCVHYQCSRSSSATEIRDLFEKAIKNQKSSDKHGGGSRFYFVFLDEAGLPEEERESLKVLHYYLEASHEQETRVGFIAGTNQMLDSAKSNRCIVLSRVAYDQEELEQIAFGCIDGGNEENFLDMTLERLEGGHIPLRMGIPLLCKQFQKFTSYKSIQILAKLNTPQEKLDGLLFPERCTEFFSFRDIIHFFKLFGRMTRSKKDDKFICFRDLMHCFQRNFNGIESVELLSLMDYILRDIQPSLLSTEKSLLNPVPLLMRSLTEMKNPNGLPFGRYLLVKNTTNSDGVLRALEFRLSQKHSNLHLIRISLLSDSLQREQINALNELQWRMSQGDLVMLVHATSINESLYDLFNQHFQERENLQTKKKYLQTSIAVGSLSVVCDVNPSFNCIVILNNEELNAAPAAFLDRLEKYSLNMAHLLHEYLHQRPRDVLWSTIQGIFIPLCRYVRHFLEFETGYSAFYGIKQFQSVESAILCLLMRWENENEVHSDLFQNWEYLMKIGLPLPTASKQHDVASWVMDHWTQRSQEWNLLQDALFQTAKREILKLFLCIAIPERIFSHLRPEWEDLYLNRENFCFFPSTSDECVSKPRTFSRELIFTRSISEDFFSSLGHLTERCILIRLTMIPHSRFELEEKLHQVWNNCSELVIYMELSSSNLDYLNFLRYCIDELYRNGQGKKMKTRIIVLIPSLDLTTDCAYDTVFNNDWKLQFLDRVEVAGFLHQWMLLARTKKNALIDSPSADSATKRFFEECLGKPTDLLQSTIWVYYSSFHDIRRLDDHSILNTLRQNVLIQGRVRLVSEFVFDLLHKRNKEGISIIAERAICSHRDLYQSESLSQSIKAEFQNSISEILTLVVTHFFPLTAKLDDQISEKKDDSHSATLVWEVLECMSQQELDLLLQPPPSHCIYLPPYPGFPFYCEVFTVMTDFMSLFLGDTVQEEKTMNWGSLLHTFVDDNIDNSMHLLISKVVEKVFNFAKRDYLFVLYVFNTVAYYLPHCSKVVQQFSSEWILSKISESSSVPCLIQLHLIYSQRGESFLAAVQAMEYIQVIFPHDLDLVSSLEETSKFITHLLSRSKKYISEGDKQTMSSFVSLLSKLFYGKETLLSKEKTVPSSSFSKVQMLKIFAEMYLAETSYETTSPISLDSLGNKFEGLCREGLNSSSEERCVESSVQIHERIDISFAYLLETNFSGKDFSALLRLAASSKDFFLAVESSTVYSRPMNVSDFTFLATIIAKHNTSRVPFSDCIRFDALMEISFSETSLFMKIGCTEWSDICEVLFPWLRDNYPLQEMGQREEKLKVIFLFVLQRLFACFLLPEHTTNGVSFISRITDYIDGFSAMQNSCIQCIALIAMKYLLVLALSDTLGTDTRLGVCGEELANRVAGHLLLPVCLKSQVMEISTWGTLLVRNPLVRSKQNEIPMILNPLISSILNNTIDRCSMNLTGFLDPPEIGTLQKLDNEIKQVFFWEIGLILLSRHLWILPCIHDFFLWIFANSRRPINVLLEISDSFRRNQWNLLRAGVCEAKHCHCNLNDLEDLPAIQDFGDESCTLLASIASKLTNVYQRLLQQGKDNGILSQTLPKVINIDVFSNLLGGNESFLAHIEAVLSNENTSFQDAEKLMRSHRNSFRMNNPVMNRLDALQVFFLTNSASCIKDDATTTACSFEIQYFLKQCVLSLPDDFPYTNIKLYNRRRSVYPSARSRPLPIKKSIGSTELNKVFHSLGYSDLKKIKHFFDNRRQELSEKTSYLKDLCSSLDEGLSVPLGAFPLENHLWYEKPCENTLLCSTGISLPPLLLHQENVVAVCEFLEKEISQQHYLFCEKPLEVKEWLPDFVNEKIHQVWKGTPDKELRELLSFLRSQEKKIILNSRTKNENHNLFSLLSYSFSSEMQLFTRYPSLRRIESCVSHNASGMVTFSLLTFHYAAVIHTLFTVLRSRNQLHDQHSTKWFTEIPLEQDISWNFIMEELLSLQSYQEYNDKKNALQRKLEAHEYRLECIKDIENDLSDLHIDDTSLVVKKARELVETYRNDEKASHESISMLSSTLFPGSSSALAVDTDIIKEHIEKNSERRFKSDHIVFNLAQELLDSLLASTGPALPLHSINMSQQFDSYEELEKSLSTTRMTLEEDY